MLPKAAILFCGSLEGPARQDWGLLQRAAAKTRLEQRPMTERLLSPQKLFDLFPPQANPSNPSNPW